MTERKKILFIERNLRNEKLGIMYLASALKSKGHHADLIQVDKEDLNERICDYHPDFIAFSISTGEHSHALQIARNVKLRYGIPNIFGGPHCTFFPEIAYEPYVDFVVFGQGEEAIIDIVERRVKPGFVKGRIVSHPDELPFPDRDIFYQYDEFRNNPLKNIITSRACPYRCSYCFNHSFLALTKIDNNTKQWFNRRSPENIIAEINEIQNKYDLEKILFIDDNFLQGGKSWLNTFIELYSQKIKIPWMCSFRVNHLDKQLAKNLFTSGLIMVNYALESADPDVQQYLLNRGHIHNADIILAVSLFEQFGINARMQNMIGLPLLNPLEDAFNTLQFNINHRVTDSWCSIFQPYPRTALGQYCVDHGFISDDQLKYCAESFFHESRLNISNKQELYALQKLWYFVIEGNIPLNLVNILIRGKYSRHIGDQLQDLRFQCSRKKLYKIDDSNSAVAINMKNRERWITNFDGSVLKETKPLIRAALKEVNLPDRFIDILTKVEFDKSELNNIIKYIRGGQLDFQYKYTIDDETGKLKDPDISIYKRGCSNSFGNDIRNMSEGHFMRDIAEVIHKLL